MMDPDFGELVVAIENGEIHRYGEIVRHFDARIRQVIGSRVQSSSTTEDLVQETFYRAFTNLHELRDPERILGWLQTIAKNCVRDHFRKLIRQQQNENKYQSNISTNQLSDRPEDHGWIWTEVDQLPKNFAEVLRLRYRHQMAYAEISKALNVPESTVRGRIHEARQALKRKLIDKRLFP